MTPGSNSRVLELAVVVGLLLTLGMIVLRRGGASSAAVAVQDSTRKNIEVGVVVFLSSACAQCRADDFAAVVQRARTAVDSVGRSERVHVAHTAAALDRDVQSGLKLADRLGKWDELVVGRTWLNTAAVDFMWRTAAADPVLPQLLVVLRRFDPQGERLTVHPDQVVLRLEGIEELRRATSQQIAQPVIAALSAALADTSVASSPAGVGS